MRKSTIFISAILTTFALVLIYNVISAYRSNQSVPTIAAAMTEPTATLAPQPTDQPAPTPIMVSALQASQLATQVVGNSNLLSAESSNIDGVVAYKITFTNNDVVYVGLDGQILSVQVAPLVVNVSLPEQQKNKNHNNSSHSSSESHDESQEHED